MRQRVIRKDGETEFPYPVWMSSKRPVWELARELRDRAGLSRTAIGKLLDMPGTSFATYDTDVFKKPHLPVDLVRKLGSILPGLGQPPITEAEVWALSGVAPASHAPQPPTRPRPTAIPADIEHAPRLDGVAEVEVTGGLGSGGHVTVEAYTTEGGDSISAELIRDIWNLPPSYMAGELRMTTKRARIIEVRGDSMEPTLWSGDRVMIDLGDRSLSQEGVFALWDGDGVAVKRLERVRPSDPPTLRLISDNPRHRAVELLAEEVNVIGRVVWVARKM